MRSLKLLVALVLIAGSAAAAWAQSAPRLRERTYFFKEAGVTVPYDLFISTRYQKGVPAPLLVALHGGGASPRSILLYQGLAELAEERGYIVVAPMGYTTRGGFGNPGRNGRRSPGDPENVSELSELDVMNVLAAVRREYTVDPNRIYLMGHSMGGGGTWHLGIKYPDIWAALAPVAPGIYTSPDALAAIKTTPVIVIQGDADRAVSIETTRTWVAKMKELGMRYEYLEVAGGDHFGVIMGAPGNMKKIFDFFDKARKK
jgi:poly(3-hydroxybutyrate) depolymerase